VSDKKHQSPSTSTDGHLNVTGRVQQPTDFISEATDPILRENLQSDKRHVAISCFISAFILLVGVAPKARDDGLYCNNAVGLSDHDCSERHLRLSTNDAASPANHF
jgi:hypothetical protein